MNPLHALLEQGQSYWLDNLTREKIISGELQDRVENQGLRGVTSNPAIFMKAISGSDAYDEDIRQLGADGLSAGEIYEHLAIDDIQSACDILRPVYDESDGVDGYVSLEVSPHLARDTKATMEEARRLFGKVDRPNCFIKIPGTKEGLPAIEEMLYEGININVTLLFSIERYEQVAQAYIRAMERRADDGNSLDDVASVASFFLSRIDVLVDEKLQSIAEDTPDESVKGIALDLRGETALASAKIAYQRFKRIFSGDPWERLADQGARVQRPLWASTSTKNPEYSDVLYVENLIAPHTVNTLPDETIEAFRDHGKVQPNTIEQGVDEAREILRQVEQIGLSMDEVTDQLVEEGIEKFVAPFEQLMGTIEEQKQELVAGE